MTMVLTEVTATFGKYNIKIIALSLIYCMFVRAFNNCILFPQSKVFLVHITIN